MSVTVRIYRPRLRRVLGMSKIQKQRFVLSTHLLCNSVMRSDISASRLRDSVQYFRGFAVIF